METAVVYRWATMFLVMIHCRFSPSEVKTSQFADATVATKVQTVEKVVEVPMVGQTLQGTTQEVDIPLAPRREDLDGDGMGWILIRQQAPLLAVSFLVLTIVSAMILVFFLEVLSTSWMHAHYTPFYFVEIHFSLFLACIVHPQSFRVCTPLT